MQPSGPHLQRITRSPRSRPSLHQSAWKCAQQRRSYTRTHARAWTLDGGTRRGGLTHSRQAAARQSHSPCPSTSTRKHASLRSRQGTVEATHRLLASAAATLVRCALLVWCDVRSGTALPRPQRLTQEPIGAAGERLKSGCRAAAERLSVAQKQPPNTHNMLPTMEPPLRGSVEMQWLFLIALSSVLIRCADTLSC